MVPRANMCRPRFLAEASCWEVGPDQEGVLSLTFHADIPGLAGCQQTPVPACGQSGLVTSRLPKRLLAHSSPWPVWGLFPKSGTHSVLFFSCSFLRGSRRLPGVTSKMDFRVIAGEHSTAPWTNHVAVSDRSLSLCVSFSPP